MASSSVQPRVRVSGTARRAAFLLCAAYSLAVAVPGVTAAPSSGRAPAGELRTVIQSLPCAITEPGSYVVGAPLAASQDADGITISSSNVTLDLNGFTVSGVAGGRAGRGIVVGGGLSGIRVRNGAVSSWGGDGLQVAGETDIVLEDLQATGCAGNGITLNGGEVRRVRCEANGRNGLATGAGAAAGGAGASLVLTDCVFTGNGQDGVNHKRPGKCKYKNIALKRNGGSGVSADGQKDALVLDLDMDGVSAQENQKSGIFCDLQTAGFHVRCRMERCRVTDNGAGGLDVLSRAAGFFECWPCRSAFSGNGGDGLQIGLEGASSRLQFTSEACTYLNNGGGGLSIRCPGEGTRANVRCVACAFNDNQGTGVSIDAPARTGGGQTDCLAALEQCVSVGNKGHGALMAHEAAHVVQQRSTGNARHGIVVRDCDDADFSEVQVLKNGGTGLVVTCQNSQCVRVTASNNGGGGVDQDCDGDADMDEVIATGNAGTGLQIRCGGQARLDRCSATRNGAAGARCVCSSGWTGDSSFSNNKGAGLEIVAADGASITGNVLTRNEAGGIVYVGSYGDVSGNRCSGHAAAESSAISVDGEQNRIARNVLTGNNRGFSLRTGVNPLYENTEGANTNPLYEEVPNDRAPAAPASKATSPVSNIQSE